MRYTLENTESDRLIFRLLKSEDFNSWLPLFEKLEVGRFLGMENLKTASEMCMKWFDLTFDRYKNDKGGMNVLIDKNTHSLIGQCGLLVQEVDDLQELEIGYSVLPKFWNQGYATEAAAKAKEAAFSHKYTESLISIVHIDNIRSEKVARKNGMVLDKKTIFKEMPVNVFRIMHPLKHNME